MEALHQTERLQPLFERGTFLPWGDDSNRIPLMRNITCVEANWLIWYKQKAMHPNILACGQLQHNVFADDFVSMSITRFLTFVWFAAYYWKIIDLPTQEGSQQYLIAIHLFMLKEFVEIDEKLLHEDCYISYSGSIESSIRLLPCGIELNRSTHLLFTFKGHSNFILEC